VTPQVEAAGALLQLPDPAGRLASVSLWYHLRRPYPARTFDRTRSGWRYWLDRPAVDRLEYLLEQTDDAGTTTLVLDPTNPRRVSGAFGEHSVLEFPGYCEPEWLSWPALAGARVDDRLPVPELDADLPVQVWTPEGIAPQARLPLLLAHDGPELDRLAQLTRYSAAMIQANVLRPHRVALLHPVDRDAWYSASPAYARALVEHAVPALLDRVPTEGRPVLMGASLGALAALHAQWAHPDTFAALFLASGSFFQLRWDSHEQGYERFWRIVDAVDAIGSTPTAASGAPVTMVCGTGEENWENNEAMAAALRRAGASVQLTPFRDGHTWVGWRDALHPSLTSMLSSLWDGATAH
jgi:enterochelin esterase-like enzyme